jgi:alpha-1,2-glucosyltransferase
MTSGLLGTLSILMRQTNAVWVGFVAAWACIEMAKKIIQSHSAAFSGAVHSSMTRFESSIDIQIIAMVESLIKFPRMWFSLWPLVVPLLGFIAFVIQNRGIVVGDRENHAPVVHVMQVFYFYAFTAVSIAPILASDIINYVHEAARRRKKLPYFTMLLLVMASGTLAYLAARFTTLVHPFILADNRHYIFYIWRRVVQSQFLFNYLLLPLCAIAPLVLFSTCTYTTLGPLLRVVIGICTFAVLTPAHLVEFRYYTIPFFLHFFSAAGRASTYSMWLTILAYLAVNMLTIYVFLFRDFIWPDGSVARFMW